MYLVWNILNGICYDRQDWLGRGGSSLQRKNRQVKKGLSSLHIERLDLEYNEIIKLYILETKPWNSSEQKL